MIAILDGLAYHNALWDFLCEGWDAALVYG